MKVAKDKFEIDVNPCILWQYNDAKNLQRLLQGEYDFFDFCTNKFWQNYIDFIFNVATASRTGLERWARIVGLPVHYATRTNNEVKNSGKSREVRVNGVTRTIHFTTLDKHEKGTKFAAMSDDFLRRSIIARFFLLDSNGSCDAINRYLYLMFGGVEVGTGVIKVCTRSRGENFAEEWEEIFATDLTRKNYDDSKTDLVNAPKLGDYFIKGGNSFINVGGSILQVKAELLKKEAVDADAEPPQVGWWYIESKSVRVEPKVYCADSRYSGMYYWQLSDNGIGSYPLVNISTATQVRHEVLDEIGNVTRTETRSVAASGKAWPMEIYYYVRVDSNTYESAVSHKYYPTADVQPDNTSAHYILCSSGGFSDEEAYVATLLANQRFFLPHPAGVRINGLDEDVPIAIAPTEYFSFELEETESGEDNDVFQKSPLMKISTFDNSSMIGET